MHYVLEDLKFKIVNIISVLEKYIGINQIEQDMEDK